MQVGTKVVSRELKNRAIGLVGIIVQDAGLDLSLHSITPNLHDITFVQDITLAISSATVPTHTHTVQVVSLRALYLIIIIQDHEALHAKADLIVSWPHLQFITF